MLPVGLLPWTMRHWHILVGSSRLAASNRVECKDTSTFMTIVPAPSALTCLSKPWLERPLWFEP